MNAQELIDAVMATLDSGKSMDQVLIAHEAARGFVVIRPGEVEWLPLTDWEPLTIVSQKGHVVRLIAIWARNPGTGAFRRLCENIKRDGSIPHVVAPMRDMQDRLKKWGWRRRTKGMGLDRQEWWTPRKG
jgi:uncharacterized NAD-dependent epimerase/dehydratase family protein